MSTQLVRVDDGVQLDVCDWGPGEPVVFVQTALTADELVPLAQTSPFERHYRKVVYHRRGFAGSSAVDGPGSVARDAADCHALLDALGIGRAHIVGVSYSAAVALQLAADAPQSVHTLVLIEPPPVHTASPAEFRAANERLFAPTQLDLAEPPSSLAVSRASAETEDGRGYDPVQDGASGADRIA